MATACQSARILRLASVASFLLAFPLCLVHGVLSHDPAPAVGLVPLCTSAIAALFFLRRPRHQPGRSDDEGIRETTERTAETTEDPTGYRPVIVFLADVAHGAALMVVLVFTWIHQQGRGNVALSMLAAYATIPLLVDFFIHLYLAVGAFCTGFAIRDLMQYLAWQAVPPDCPNCSHRVRPASLPPIPWLQSQSSGIPSRWKLKMPAISAAEWKVPTWLRVRGGGEEARLFVAEEERYRDFPEDGEPSGVDQPEPVDVIVKRDRKGPTAPVREGD